MEITDCLYKLVVNKTVKTNQIEIAETSKIYENVYRSVNIALVNELKFILQKLNIDIENSLGRIEDTVIDSLFKIEDYLVLLDYYQQGIVKYA